MLFDATGRHFHSEIQHPASKIQYLCNKVLLDGSGRHFHSEIQHPASKRYENYIQVPVTSGSCQIVDIDVLLGRSIQHLCNEVLFHGSARMKTLYAKSPNLLVIPEKNLVNHVGDSSATK